LNEQAARVRDTHQLFKHLPQRKIFTAANLIGLVDHVRVLERPEQACD
jgi:hypothetical protein